MHSATVLHITFVLYMYMYVQFYIAESCLEVLARHMLFLTLLLESPETIGLQGKPKSATSGGPNDVVCTLTHIGDDFFFFTCRKS